MKNVGGRNEISFSNSNLAKVPFKKYYPGHRIKLPWPIVPHALKEYLIEGFREIARAHCLWYN